MKQNVIISACDRRYGDFLIEHWYASLVAHSSLDRSDVAILDYGLSVAQRYWLESHGALLHPCVRDGHPAVIRYRDAAELLEQKPWDQVALCDAGDIIFQDDPEAVFDIEPSSFRAVTEDYKPPFSVFISPEFFAPKDRERLTERFILSPIINGGFVVAPREKMIHLSREVLGTTKIWTKFGPDQIVLTDLLWTEGFHEMDKLWNYVVATAKEGVRIQDGQFYTEAGRKPVVVHNAGNLSFLRPVENFGFGPGHNQIREDLYHALRGLYQSMEGLFKTQEVFVESRHRFRSRLKSILQDLGYGDMEDHDS